MAASPTLDAQRLEDLRAWLAANLPDEPPARTNVKTWDIVRRFVAGASVDDLARETGKRRRSILVLLRRTATRLGLNLTGGVAWLLADDTLSPSAFINDPVTGCLRWRGAIKSSIQGPWVRLPVRHLAAPGGEPREARETAVDLRRWLYEREYGRVPESARVRPGCGDASCVAPAHGVLLPRRLVDQAGDPHGLRERKGQETVSQAARRTGLKAAQVVVRRGPGGYRTNQAEELRARIRLVLPTERPAAINALDWQCLQRFMAGATYERIGAELGVSKQMVGFRVKRAADRLTASPTVTENRTENRQERGRNAGPKRRDDRGGAATVDDDGRHHDGPTGDTGSGNTRSGDSGSNAGHDR